MIDTSVVSPYAKVKKWIITNDAQISKIPFTPTSSYDTYYKRVPKLTLVDGGIVYIKHQGSWREMVLLDKGIFGNDYKLIDINDIMPLHAYYLAQKAQLEKTEDGRNKLAWAERTNKEVMSSFDATILDLTNVPSDFVDNIPAVIRNNEIYTGGDSFDFRGGGDMFFDGEQDSNAIGDWFKNIFKKKGVSEQKAKEIADPNKVVYTPEEMAIVYQSSGTNKPFKSWLNSDSGKNFLDTLSKVGYQVLLNQEIIRAGGTPGSGYNQNTNTDDDKKGIPGWAIALIAVGVVGATLGIIYMIRKNKTKVKTKK